MVLSFTNLYFKVETSIYIKVLQLSYVLESSSNSVYSSLSCVPWGKLLIYWSSVENLVVHFLAKCPFIPHLKQRFVLALQSPKWLPPHFSQLGSVSFTFLLARDLVLLVLRWFLFLLLLTCLCNYLPFWVLLLPYDSLHFPLYSNFLALIYFSWFNWCRKQKVKSLLHKRASAFFRK